MRPYEDGNYIDIEEMPTAVWSGSFRLFGIDVQCHRLSDGRNIIEADSMARLMDAMANGTMDVGDVEAFSKFQAGSVPKPSAVHPDKGTPNWCPVCSPKNLGYCRCEIASNE